MILTLSVSSRIYATSLDNSPQEVQRKRSSEVELYGGQDSDLHLPNVLLCICPVGYVDEVLNPRSIDLLIL